MSVSKNECLCLRNIVFSSWETRSFSHCEKIFIPEKHHLCLMGILSLSQKHCLCLRANCFCLRNSGFVSWKLGDCLIFKLFLSQGNTVLASENHCLYPWEMSFCIEKDERQILQKDRDNNQKTQLKASNQSEASIQAEPSSQSEASSQTEARNRSKEEGYDSQDTVDGKDETETKTEKEIPEHDEKKFQQKPQAR